MGFQSELDNYVFWCRDEQLKLIDKFKEDLKLNSALCKTKNFEFRHYWITDGTYIMEFGSINDDSYDSVLKIYENQFENNFDSVTEERFKKTESVTNRMKKVCGASNYCLPLRNSEHLARYIYCGAWLSNQANRNGNITYFNF